MITYSIHPLGALINSGFKIIFPFGVQLPQRVGMFLSMIEDGSTLCFLKSLISGLAIALNFDFAFCKYHSLTNCFTLDLSVAVTSINFPFNLTDSIIFCAIFKRYCLPRYRCVSPPINFLAGVFGWK